MKFIGKIRKIFRSIYRSNDESGNVLILAMLSSAIFLAVTGLVVDYGTAVMMESKLKTASDVAALAGIQELPYQSYSQAKMQEYMEQNYPDTTNCNVEYFSDDESCWLISSANVPTYFMRYFGMENLTIHARSKAILEPIEGVSGGKGVTPFVIVNPNKNTTGNDDLVESNHGKPYILKYGTDNIMLEDWYYGRQIVGEGVVHDETSLPDGGWRSTLGLDPDSDDPEVSSLAASDLQENFAVGWTGSIEIGHILNSNPGVIDSAIRKGRDVRLDGYTSVSWAGFDANLDAESNRIVLVPVVSLGDFDECGVWHEATHAEIESGTYTWKSSKVDGFAAFFMLSEDEQSILPGGDQIDSKWVVGRFLYGVNIGGEILTPGNSQGPDFGMSMGRLVPF